MANISSPGWGDNFLVLSQLAGSKAVISAKSGVSLMHKKSLACIESANDISVCNDIQLEYIAWINAMLIRLYASRLSINSAHQIMGEITSNWPLYSGRHGRFYLAFIGRSVGGMAGIKLASKDECELKRLYVSPRYRRSGIGRSLVERLLADARMLGYSKVRLETLDFMVEAIRLYESLGFVRTAEFEGAEGRGYGIQEHEIYFALDL